MKTLITSFLLAIALIGFTANAQTNAVNTTSFLVETVVSTNSADASSKTAGSWEVTLGGGGETIDGESYFGLDFSLSTNPLESRPEVWVGLAQSTYWETDFAGTTDVFVDWSQSIFPTTFDDSLYLNVGWSVGTLYNDEYDFTWRTGPEATFQYYTSDTAFIYAGVNYDVYQSEGDEGEFRYSFGIGITF